MKRCAHVSARSTYSAASARNRRAHSPRLEARRQSGGLSRRRHQRCFRTGRGRCWYLRRQRAADVAKEAADLVLLEHDLGGVRDRVIEGRAYGGERDQVYLDGLKLELRQYVQHGRRGRCFCPSCRCCRPKCSSTTFSTTSRKLACRFDNV